MGMGKAWSRLEHAKRLHALGTTKGDDEFHGNATMTAYDAVFLALQDWAYWRTKPPARGNARGPGAHKHVLDHLKGHGREEIAANVKQLTQDRAAWKYRNPGHLMGEDLADQAATNIALAEDIIRRCQEWTENADE